jgi:hypothetical protein
MSFNSSCPDLKLFGFSSLCDFNTQGNKKLSGQVQRVKALSTQVGNMQMPRFTSLKRQVNTKAVDDGNDKCCEPQTQGAVNRVEYILNNRNTVVTYYPIAVSNRTVSPITKIWKINLPENSQTDAVPEYVFTMGINLDFCEFNLTGTGSGGIITGDINTANSYFFKSNFVNDTTWSPEILPQSQYTPSVVGFQPSVYKCNSSLPSEATTTFNIEYENSNRFYYLKAVLQPNTYVVGTLHLVYGDIYPPEQVLYDNFNFTIELIQ